MIVSLQPLAVLQMDNAGQKRMQYLPRAVGVSADYFFCLRGR